MDGYNIIFAWDELKDLAKDNLDAARQVLMDLLSNYQGFHKCEVILVFDAYKVPGGLGEVSRYHNIYVVYTKEAETADAYIEKATYEIAKKYRVRVATSDAAEQLIILGMGRCAFLPGRSRKRSALRTGRLGDIDRKQPSPPHFDGQGRYGQGFGKDVKRKAMALGSDVWNPMGAGGKRQHAGRFNRSLALGNPMGKGAQERQPLKVPVPLQQQTFGKLGGRRCPVGRCCLKGGNSRAFPLLPQPCGLHPPAIALHGSSEKGAAIAKEAAPHSHNRKRKKLAAYSRPVFFKKLEQIFDFLLQFANKRTILVAY